VVLRGNFSLELNRVPWIHSRTETCDERSELGAQLGAQGCRTCAGSVQSEQPALEEAACQSGSCAEPCARCVGPVRAALINLKTLGWCLRAAHGPTAVVGSGGSSRFHPVPTQPVFSQRDWELGPAPASGWNAAGGSAAAAAPEPAASPGELPDAPAPESLKSLPAEPAPGAEAPEVDQDSQSSVPRPVRSWVFLVPEPQQLDPVAALPAQTSRRIARR